MYCNCTLRMIFFLVLFDTLKLVLTKSYNIVEPESNSNETTETKVKLQSFRNLIINGTPSPRRLFYARVKLIRQHGFCGASILDGSFILTAASCVAAKHRKFQHVAPTDITRVMLNLFPKIFLKTRLVIMTFFKVGSNILKIEGCLFAVDRKEESQTIRFTSIFSFLIIL